MLCNGTVSYRDLYYATESTFTSKSSNQSSISILILKITLTVGLHANYCCDHDNLVLDLERKMIHDKLLVTAQSLHGLAKMRVTFYQTEKPKELGMTVVDIIEFVPRQMYPDIEGDDVVEEEKDLDEVSEEKDDKSDDKDNGGNNSVDK